MSLFDDFLESTEPIAETRLPVDIVQDNQKINTAHPLPPKLNKVNCKEHHL